MVEQRFKNLYTVRGSRDAQYFGFQSRTSLSNPQEPARG